MQTIFYGIFALELALLFTHEMDAIRKQEWNMFIILKDMPDEKAYHTFMLLHIPLYTAIILLLFSDFRQIGFYIVDAFLMIHLLIHWGFCNHPANKLNGGISKAIISGAGLLSIPHLLAMIFGKI